VKEMGMPEFGTEEEKHKIKKTAIDLFTSIVKQRKFQEIWGWFGSYEYLRAGTEMVCYNIYCTSENETSEQFGRRVIFNIYYCCYT
jgi:hypothetical protein